MWRAGSGTKFNWTGWENLVKTPEGPIYLAIERSSDHKHLTSSWSTDGVDWKVIQKMDLNLGKDPLAGLIASSWTSPFSLRVYTAGANVMSDAVGNASIPLAISDNGKAISITERFGPIAKGAEIRIHDYMPRIEGLSTMALWTSRPRIIRQFGWGDFDGQIDAEWKALLRATDAVWNEPVLTRFWRKGVMVPNSDYQKETGRNHPMGDGLNKEPWKSLWAGEDRFFQLTVDINPPFKVWPKDNDVSDTSPDNVNGRIKVWAIAYELGQAPKREWLLIAQSPSEDRKNVAVTVPGFGNVKVDAAIRGSFYHLQEGKTGIRNVVTETAHNRDKKQ